ncbi:hypothetical protein KFV02_01160 [Desulfohalobiaceae bacterium Ax17]|uniref:hypothetical protein n=1 Tax=Desulfovulcanus ferrireducens TaxID=2831190 RepID=UPI00207BCB4C|nr:hypothetical protein [Desulfovulcanus ferrireducens]MBT8762540.1 hypothetical protein [Desulfovulcanus ferrireducens]
MKRLIFSCVLILMFLVGTAFAETWKCYYPKGTEIISSEFSTGGGKKVIMYIEVDVRYPDGRYVKYLDSIIKTAGFLGLGRIVIPDKIVFVPWDKDAIRLED